MESSLYDTQDVTDYTQNINNQTSIPHGTGRGKTLEWDSFHRDSSLNFYNFGQISSMRTPHGHFAPRNDYMRFSTPYNPLHTGPFDSRNGFNQSFDMMYGPNTSNNNYHPRHPSMGSPIRYNGTAPPANGYGRSYYSEDTHLRQGNWCLACCLFNELFRIRFCLFESLRLTYLSGDCHRVSFFE